MKAMILSAGLGTRLQPLTRRWPKPAIPLLGQPLFRYSLATLRHAGIREIGINTHHLPQVMESVARAECERTQCSLTVSHENGEIQGTGGGIRGLKSFLQSDQFVVLNGDVLFSLDLQPVIAEHLASGAAATMVLMPMPPNEKFNPVETDAAGDVRRIAGLGPGGDRLSPWHFTGVHVMTPAVFDFMAPSGAEDINRDVYQRMLAKGLRIRGHFLRVDSAYWSDMGTPQRYTDTHQRLLFSQVPTKFFGDADPFAHATRFSSGWTRSELPTSLKAAGPAFIAEGVTFGRDVRLGAAVSVGTGATIGDSVHLNRVAVLDGAHVPSGGLYEDCLIATIDGKTVVTDARPVITS